MCNALNTIITTVSIAGELERKKLLNAKIGELSKNQIKYKVNCLVECGSIEKVNGSNKSGVVYRATGKAHSAPCLACLKPVGVWTLSSDGRCGFCVQLNKSINHDEPITHPAEQLKHLLPIGYVWQLINRKQKELNP
ncbi:hypothetical protein ERW49_18705 [Aliivibrio finisterrensis]|uniref:Uncharacterized protein n=1 Tax=Aliivibrio finisterrensis TaxID=511998 RepID=A0A4Q5K6G5_9GAMM|nr:hypothetical protein [Aliivibrio finisterrensis]RYU41311.1 hypothetical protein ERW49_18705 [Aliivibrio finisterrensis]